MKHTELILIENHFENEILDHPQPFVNFILNSLKILLTNDYVRFYETLEQFPLNLKIENKNFADGIRLIWLIVATERQYDIQRRELYLFQFLNIANIEFNPYFEYYRHFFIGVTHAFKSQTIEAEAYYRKSLEIAESLHYFRGISRSILHIGLIRMQIGDHIDGQKLFLQSRSIAIENNLLVTTRKIEAFIPQKKSVEAAGDVIDLVHVRNHILQLIREGDFGFARMRLVKAEIYRRKLKMYRKAHSFYLLHGVLSGFKKKYKICLSIFNKLDDPVLRYEYYELLKESTVEFSETVKLEMKYILNGTMSLRTFQKIKLSTIKNLRIKAFLQLISSSTMPLPKEVLVREVFGVHYDPTVHDILLYRLISKTRHLVGESAIVNHSGSYSIDLSICKVVS